VDNDQQYGRLLHDCMMVFVVPLMAFHCCWTILGQLRCFLDVHYLLSSVQNQYPQVSGTSNIKAQNKNSIRPKWTHFIGRFPPDSSLRFEWYYYWLLILSSSSSKNTKLRLAPVPQFFSSLNLRIASSADLRSAKYK